MNKIYKNRMLYCGIVCLVLGFIFISIFIFPRISPQSPIQINGTKITKEELQLFLDNQRLHEEGTNMTIQMALEDKLLQMWALEIGIVKDISFKTFLKNYTTAMEERKVKSEKGEVLYGPVSYSVWEYYRYIQNEYESKIKETLAKEVEDEGVLLTYYYETIEDYKKADTVKGELSIWENGIAVSFHEVEITHETMRLSTESNEELANHLLSLQVGDTVSWGEKEKQQYLLTCTYRETGEYMKYDEVIQAVQASYVDELFQKELEERLNEEEIIYAKDLKTKYVSFQ